MVPSSLQLLQKEGYGINGERTHTWYPPNAPLERKKSVKNCLTLSSQSTQEKHSSETYCVDAGFSLPTISKLDGNMYFKAF